MKQSFSLACSTAMACIAACLLLTTLHAAPLDKRSIPSCYKSSVRLTYYWIPKEGDKDMNNKGKSITLSGSKTKKLKDKNSKEISKVSKTTYNKFQMEGTGLLKSGIMVNLGSGGKNVFMKVDRKKTPYGLGSNSKALTPWASVASNDIKLGTTLYIKDLDGVSLPNGKKHNGCVRVDDRSWSMGGCQIDFFVLQFSAYQQLNRKISSKVKVVEKSCKVQDYVNSNVKKWAVLT
ncbi:Eukaryotic translation initiation factor 3 subunit L (eIF3l) [Mucor velutinosus]|uniref:Eukaryotic translation initiation factor 3 subunit L (eIF3l) n=1 Tax=Mucor velutinosus TaxID=708070 RepID=A0AAN7DI17_9FUNG|nr:Eukaryotic translation initiation factor 3 subunit L (eIF3l) [Mucor velutinosus]